MKNKILVIACLVLVLCVSLVLPMTTAFADYTNDILNNPQAIVNFNQLILDTYVQDYTYTSTGINYVSSAGLVLNHVYYVDFDCITTDNPNTNGLYIRNANNAYMTIFNPFRVGNNSLVFTNNVENSQMYVYIRSGSSEIKNFKLVDITQMVGLGNDNITLQQCKDLFVADYYSFNTGTAMSFGALNAYNDGVQSVLGSDPIIYNNIYVFNNAQEYTYNYMDSKVLKYADPNLTGDNIYMYPELYFMNSCYIPFSVSVRSNISVNVSWSVAGNANYTDNYLMVFALDENNNLILIENIDEWLPTYYSKDFIFERSISGLVFVCTIDNTNKYCGINDLTITIYDRDITSLITSSYNRGYYAGLDYYKKLYSRGSAAWDAIYYEGYYDYPTDDHFTFKSLITSAVDVPVQAMTNLFDFDILGVNMKTFYLSVFTLCVIFVVLRLVL